MDSWNLHRAAKGHYGLSVPVIRSCAWDKLVLGYVVGTKAARLTNSW